MVSHPNVLSLIGNTPLVELQALDGVLADSSSSWKAKTPADRSRTGSAGR